MDGIKELKNCPFISFQEMKNAFLDRNINIGVDVNRYTREFVRNNPWTNAILFLIIIALAYPLVIGR